MESNPNHNFQTMEAQVFGQTQTEITNPEFKKFIMDVAKPLEKFNDMDFNDYKSEICLKNQQVIVHHLNGDQVRKRVAFTLPAERFQSKNYTFETLKNSIKQIYQAMYSQLKTQQLIDQIFEKNLQQAKLKLKESLFEKIENGEAIVFALTFYLGIKQEEEEQDQDFEDYEIRREGGMFAARFFHMQDDAPMQIQVENEFVDALLSCKNEQEELCWWINKGLSYIQPYVGESTRLVQINDQQMIEYYKPGKVFNWLQFSSANKGSIVSKWTKKRNVVFHIYGQTSRSVVEFQAQDDLQDEQTVIFSPGSEFLVCKSQKIQDQTHIWIREIHTGFASNVVLWVDDHLFPEGQEQKDIENQKYLHSIYYKAFEKNINFILKSDTETAFAYLKSEFFKVSLQVCKSFKIITDMERFNESQNLEECKVAGANFLSKFKKLTADFNKIEKVKLMVFCGYKKNAQKALGKFGMLEGDPETPKITTTPNEFIKFLELDE